MATKINGGFILATLVHHECERFGGDAPLLLLVELGGREGRRRCRIRRKRRLCCPLHYSTRRRGGAMTTMSSLQLRLLRFLVKRLGEISLHGEENSHLRVGGIVEFALLIKSTRCCSAIQQSTHTIVGSAVVGVHCHTSLELLDFVRKSVSSIEVAGKGGKKIAGIRQSAAMRAHRRQAGTAPSPWVPWAWPFGVKDDYCGVRAVATIARVWLGLRLRPAIPPEASASMARCPCCFLLSMRDRREEEVPDPDEASALLPPPLPKEEKTLCQDHHELITAAASQLLGEKIGGNSSLGSHMRVGGTVEFALSIKSSTATPGGDAPSRLKCNHFCADQLGLVGISFVEAVGKGGKEIAGIRQSAAMGVGMVGHVL
uniref:Uncharacterized protein n=1 Tax=Oryza nivara TaxID=4536 RepID=A0A0E0FUL5_ORYNI